MQIVVSETVCIVVEATRGKNKDTGMRWLAFSVLTTDYVLAQGKDSGATFVYTDESCAETTKSVSNEMGTVKVGRSI